MAFSLSTSMNGRQEGLMRFSSIPTMFFRGMGSVSDPLPPCAVGSWLRRDPGCSTETWQRRHPILGRRCFWGQGGLGARGEEYERSKVGFSDQGEFRRRVKVESVSGAPQSMLPAGTTHWHICPVTLAINSKSLS